MKALRIVSTLSRSGIVGRVLTYPIDMGNPNEAATGAIVATYIAGEAVGAIIQSLLGDRLGRKRFMQMMCLVVSTHSFMSRSAKEILCVVRLQSEL